MTGADIVRKLSSRKFWAAIIGFVTALLTALNISTLTIEQVVAIIGAVGTLVAYILAEGYVDGKRVAESGGAVYDFTVPAADIEGLSDLIRAMRGTSKMGNP